MYRVIGLDIGTKRIGIALSDPLLITAQPFTTIDRKPEKDAIDQIANIIKEYSVKLTKELVEKFNINFTNSTEKFYTIEKDKAGNIVINIPLIHETFHNTIYIVEDILLD